jgi:hypothetical protein
MEILGWAIAVVLAVVIYYLVKKYEGHVGMLNKALEINRAQIEENKAKIEANAENISLNKNSISKNKTNITKNKKTLELNQDIIARLK